MNRLQRTSVIALACVLTRCGPAPRTTTSAALPAPSVDEARWISPVLATRADQLRDALITDGLRWRGVLASGIITHGTHISTTLDLPLGRCLTLFALVTNGVRDVDARVFNDDGDVLAEDVSPDAHPTIQLCAQSALRVHHVLEAFDGLGPYALVAIESDASALPRLAEFVGGRPGTWQGDEPERGDTPRARAQRLRSMLSRAGFQSMRDATTVRFSEPAPTRIPLRVQAGTCYTFAAIRSSSDLQLQTRVLDARDVTLASDSTPNADSAVQWCARDNETLSIELRAIAGEGTATILLSQADAAKLGGATALWLGERSSTRASALTLDQAIPALQRRLDSLGCRTTGVATRVHLAAGLVHSLTLPITAVNTCVAVAAADSPREGTLALSLVDGEHNPSRTVETADGWIAFSCAHRAAEQSTGYVVRMGGSGEVATTTCSLAWPEWAESTAPSMVSAWLAETSALVHREHPWRTTTAPRVGTIHNAVVEYDETIAAQHCMQVIAVTEASIGIVHLELKEPDGVVLSQENGLSAVRVTACNDESSAVRVRVRLSPLDMTRNGRYVSQSFHRNETMVGTRARVEGP